jgi:uncharacterized protein (TIGR02246 family)
MPAPRTIDDVFAAYVAAAGAKDVEGFASLYAEGVHVFDLWERWEYDGRPAWREMAAGWFGGLGDENVAVEFDDVRQIVGDDVAVASAMVTYSGIAADGTKLRSMHNRITLGLTRTPDGGWEIAHEHSSGPVDPATGKVDLSGGK